MRSGATRRYFTLALVLAGLMIFAACGEERVVDVSDGTHEGASDADNQGYVGVELTVEGGEITEVEWTEFTGEGDAKGDDYPWDEWHEAQDELPARVIEAQSADIDVVAGATSTSEKFIQAVQRALGEKEDDVGPFADGEHIGVSDPTPRGYVQSEIVVQRGVITHADLREFQADGSEKGEDYPWDEWHVAKEELPEQVVEEQTHDVDIIAGATGTAERFIQATARALGEEEPFEVGEFEDGIYTAESDLSERGGWVEVEVTVILGHIMDVEMTEYSEDETAKDPEEYDWEEFGIAVEELPERAIDAQSADIDIVAGATSTSEMFIQALERALQEAQ